MKLATVLFLCLVLLKLAPYTSKRCSRSGMFDEHVAIGQDVTRVEQEFAKHLFVPKQKTLPVYALTHGEGPMIKKDTWTPWDDRKLPIRNDMERSYAVLPNSVSFPGVKKRLLETFLFRRNGRKRDQIPDSYL